MLKVVNSLGYINLTATTIMSSEDISSQNYNYFNTLYNNSKINATLIMQPDGVVLGINDAFTSAFEYTKDDIAGKKFDLLFIAEDRKKGLPAKELSEVMETGQATDKNYLVKKNQEPVWVSGETLKITDEKGNIIFLKILQDISEQKRAELALRQANEFNERILNTIDDIVIVLDKDLKIIKANPAFYLLFKRNEPQKPLTDFIAFLTPYDRKGELLKYITRLAATGETFTDVELEIATLNGDRIFDITGRHINTPESPDGILLVIHEITVQKQAEREREDIIGFVAHELRNPLSNIILCNEMLKHLMHTGGQPNSESESILQRSQNNVFRLNKMIGELYEATKINSGNFLLEITEFDFDVMITEAIDTVQVLQPAFNIIIEGRGGKVKGDRHRLIQVVTNYLSNSIKYSNGNKDVKINISRNDNLVTVSVQDKGLGIPGNQLPYIFDRFFRAEKTKNLEGIGLGLFLCRRIIDAHHGNVWAESEEGKGSCFYFSIPAS
jgi:PAS domain S-box-containing protein